MVHFRSKQAQIRISTVILIKKMSVNLGKICFTVFKSCTKSSLLKPEPWLWSSRRIWIIMLSTINNSATDGSIFSRSIFAARLETPINRTLHWYHYNAAGITLHFKHNKLIHILLNFGCWTERIVELLLEIEQWQFLSRYLPEHWEQI